MVKIGNLCSRNDRQKPWGGPWLDRFRRLDTQAVLLALLLAASACSDKPAGPPKALAVVNGKEITVGEFDLRWSQMPEFARKSYGSPEGRKKFLEELVTRELLLQEAKKRGLDHDRALVERVERFKERSILDNLMKEEVDSRVTVTQEEIKNFYTTHSENFTAPPALRVSHILVKTEADALDLKKRLNEGEDFAGLARKVSLDLTTRYRGGDLGVIKPGQMVPQFEQAVRHLKIGEISAPVATQFGYHIIKLNDRPAGTAQTFEETKDQVKDQLLLEKKRKRFDELVASLRAKAKLRVADVPIPVPDAPAAGPAATAP
jgi:peptidyl-prolyl cis-trans isomerase C